MPATQRKKRGRPFGTVKFPERMQLVVDQAFLDMVDTWCAMKPGDLSRSNAVRRMVQDAYERLIADPVPR
jgi:hypothetical protein